MAEADSFDYGNDFFDIDEPQTLEEAIKDLKDSREDLKMKERLFKKKWKEELRELKIGRILEDEDDINDDDDE